jgi:hypothetical protein
MGDKGGVVVFVKLTRDVVRRVEQSLRAGGGSGQSQDCDQGQLSEFFHVVTVNKVEV